MAKISKANLTLLASIVAAMANDATPYAMLTEAEIAGLTKEGLVEINPEIRDGDKLAVRATDKGMQMNTENPAPAAAAAPATAAVPVARPVILTGTGFVPSPKRAGRGRTMYDFDGLGVGDGSLIFVPNTEKRPDAAKSLASTVSSASKRSAPKKFEAQPVENGKVYGGFTAPADGAVIYRSA